jgi:hypothetical protein
MSIEAARLMLIGSAIASGLLPLWSTPYAIAAPKVLHEYVPPPSAQDQYRWLERGKLPKALKAGKHALPRPSFSEVGRTQRIRADRQSSISPDRTTTQDGRLQYKAIFNPSVVPFKRITAMDAVDSSLRLIVKNSALGKLARENTPTPPTHDAFWGTIELHFKANRAIPVPSVAPGARIVSYSASPQATLSFFRDSADNVWVRSSKPGRVKVVFLTDAPRSYFAPEIPSFLTARDIPPSIRPTLPPNAREQARQVIEHIGIKATALHTQLERLIAYFRNFKAGKLARRGKSTYLDIALSQRGVCRHRSYAFVITAHALGIPARYVQNEAHAFTEVFVPRLGWVRVDLGGASLGLDVSGARKRRVHRGRDPFPRPARYTTQYSELGQNVRGVSRSQFIRRRRRLRRLPTARGGSRSSASSGTRSTTGAIRGGGAATGSGSVLSDPTNGDPSGSAPPIAVKIPLEVTLSSQPRRVLRGSPLLVWGRVMARGTGLSGARVEIHISRDGKNSLIIGAVIAGADGSYKAKLEVPTDIAVGSYLVYGVVPETAKHTSAISN